MTTLAGGERKGSRDGPAAQATFKDLYGITAHGRTLFLADYGNDKVRAIARAVAAGADAPKEDAIRDFLRERLAAYKVPRCILFFAREDLALTGSQKVQVGPLREAAKGRLASLGLEVDGYRYRAEDAGG